MTTTAAPPVTVLEQQRRTGPIAWLASLDHKKLGLFLIGMSFFWFLAGGIDAMVMRTELAEPGLQFLSYHSYNEVFTIHGSTMIYLFVTPVGLGFGLYLVPLQIGAPNLAFPRVALFGVWVQQAAGLIMYLGFATGHGAGRAGWFAFYPLSGARFTPGYGMSMWVVAVILVSVAQWLIALSIMATVVRYRAPGMTMLRLPPFTWGIIVACLMVLGSWPVLTGGMTMLLGDRESWWHVFNGVQGPGLYQNMFWFYGHPVVYVMFFPFSAMAFEVIAACSRKRFVGYIPMVIALLAFAGLSMSVWGHHMFTTGYNVNEYFALTSTMLIIPAGIEYFDSIATMIGGRVRLCTPMLFALGFLLFFLIGGLSGVWMGSPPLDYHIEDSYVIVAHFHYTLFGGSFFGLMAGLYFWWPKFFGWSLRESLGKWHFWFTALGFNATFFPMFFLGWGGMSRRVADYTTTEVHWAWLNWVSSAGAGLLAISVFLLVANIVVSWRDKVREENPYEGQGLEWWASSPPPRHNFDSLPPIRSYAPVLDYRLEEAARART